MIAHAHKVKEDHHPDFHALVVRHVPQDNLAISEREIVNAYLVLVD